MRTITALAALLAFATPAHSECLACWSLDSVELELSSGEKLSGYLPWNDGWVFIDQKRLGLVEALTTRDPAVHTELSKLNLYLYPELLELKFEPLAGKRVAVKQPIKIDHSQIASITISSGAHTGYAGAGLIAHIDAVGDALLLKSKRPRYVIELGADLGDNYYVVYGESVAPRALLWHIARTQHNYNEPNIRIKGVPIFGRNTAGPYRPVDDVLTSGFEENEIRQFREFVDEFRSYIRERDSASAPCRRERGALSKRWRSLAKDDPANGPLKSDLGAIQSKCNQIERTVLDKYPDSLGDKEQLSKLGVIQMGFAWD